MHQQKIYASPGINTAVKVHNAKGGTTHTNTNIWSVNLQT